MSIIGITVGTPMSPNTLKDKIIGDRLDRVESQIADILYEPISITSFANNIGTAVIGSTVNDINLTWELSKPPVKLTLDGAEIDSSTTSKDLNGLGITTKKTWTLEATDERGAVAKKTTTLNFRNYIYYGVATAEEMTSGSLNNISKILSDTKARTFTVNAGEGEYIVYAIPKRLGTCSFKVGGFDGGFILASTMSLNNETGYGEEYYIYVSSNTSLGETTVEVK